MFKVLDEACKPKRSTKYSAYVDLFAREDVTIGAGETAVIPLGVKLDLENSNVYKTSDYRWACKKGAGLEVVEAMKKQALKDFMQSNYLEVALRSSLGVKGLIIANGIGIIDLDYPDEIGLIVHKPLSAGEDFNTNGSLICFGDSNHSFKINKGDKVAQCTLKEHKGYLMGYESDVVRDGGFGSTGA